MIRSATDDGVWRITLDRPDKRNALTPDAFASLRERLESPPPKARALLLTGEGKAFTAGFDLTACREDPQRLIGQLLTNLSRSIRAMRDLPMGVVVCAHGAAIAGGCALLGGADVIVADRNAKLGYPVVRLGISPAVSGPFLMRSVPPGRARALMLDPGLVTGERSHAMGLVDEVTGTPEEALDRAGAIARRLAAHPPAAIAATRGWLAELETLTDAEADAGLAGSTAGLGSDETEARLTRFWEQHA